MIRYASCVWELPMPTTFRAYQPNQPLLLPPDLQEWVPPGHLAHHVSDVVDALDLTAFYAPYEGDGRRNAPYEPSMMVKVLIYAYATGTFSSRAVARKLEEDVAFRILAAGNFPQHRTVCEFRRRHLAEFSELFVGVVQVAREMGLARFGKLSVDGTKVRANASKRKAMSYERMGKEASRLQAEIEALLTKAGMVDAEEDERWGEDFRGDELPEELQRREKRLAAIQASEGAMQKVSTNGVIQFHQFGLRRPFRPDSIPFLRHIELAAKRRPRFEVLVHECKLDHNLTQLEFGHCCRYLFQAPPKERHRRAGIVEHGQQSKVIKAQEHRLRVGKIGEVEYVGRCHRDAPARTETNRSPPALPHNHCRNNEQCNEDGGGYPRHEDRRCSPALPGIEVQAKVPIPEMCL